MNRIISVQMRGAPSVSGDLYYSAGQDGATGIFELWTLAGGSPSLAWTGAAGEYIYCLFYCQIDSQYYMLTCDAASKTYGRVYRWVAGNTPALASEGSYWEPVQAAEFGGSLYVWSACRWDTSDGTWTNNGGSVVKIAPVTLNRTVVLEIIGTYDSMGDRVSGGMGCDGTTLWAVDAGYVYTSTNGADWSQYWAWDESTPSYIGPVISSEANGEVLAAFNYHYHEAPAAAPYYLLPGGPLPAFTWFAYQSVQPDTWGLACLSGTYYGACSQDVVERSTAFLIGNPTAGVWSDLGNVNALSGLWYPSKPKSLVPMGSVLYGLFNNGIVDPPTVVLAKYESETWSTISTHTGRYGNRRGAMAVASTLKSHEV